MTNADEWKDGFPGWYIEDPDSTTDLIIHIDAELEKTEWFRAKLAQETFCLVCSKPGVHVHSLEMT